MKKIDITKDGVLTNSATFETLELLTEWFEKHKEMGSFGENFEHSISDAPSLAQEKINAEAKAYLAETDFYAIRFAETGVSYPEEIKEARQAARERIK